MTAHEFGVLLIALMLWGAILAGVVEVVIGVTNWWRKGGDDLARALHQAEYERGDR